MQKTEEIIKLEKELDSLKSEFESLRAILLSQYDKWVDVEKKYLEKLEEYQKLTHNGN